MASGQDTRQTTRDSFAFAPAAPAQTRSTASGQSAGANVYGGNSTSGVERASPITLPDGTQPSGLGKFIDGLMEPYMQKKQQERFVDGFQKAESGVALKEITESHSGISKIFGPSSYEQGAQFYTAQTAANQWALDRQNEQSELIKMDPATAAKHVYETSRAILTGDPQADAMINDTIIKQTGPLLNTIAKGRYAWQQENAKRAQTANAGTAAALFQNTAATQAGLSNPADADPAAVAASEQSFLGTLQQVAGQSDESYRSFLGDTALNAIQSKNFHAYRAMKKAGVLAVLPEDVQDKIEAKQHKFENLAVQDVMPQYVPRYLAMVTAQQRDPQDPKYMGPAAAAAELADINARIMRSTGIEEPPFDYKDMIGVGKTGVDALVGYARRAETRAQAIADRDEQRGYVASQKEQERTAEVTAAQTAWSMGKPVDGILKGVKESDIELLAQQSFYTGDFTSLAAAFNNQGYKAGKAAQVMQASVTAATDHGFNEDFKRAHDTWSKLKALSGGAAMAYYGEHNAKMLAFDTLSKTMTPDLAYRKSFGNPAAFGEGEIPKSRYKEFAGLIDSAVDGQDTAFPLWGMRGRPIMSANARQVYKNALSRQVASSAANSDVSTEALMRDGTQAILANGSFERYGSQAWANPAGTTPLWRLVGVPNEQSLDKPMQTVLYNKLAAAGFKQAHPVLGSNADDDISITRLEDTALGGSIHAHATDSDGKQYDVLVTTHELHDAVTSEVAAKAAAAKAKAEVLAPYGGERGDALGRAIRGRTGANYDKQGRYIGK